MEILFQRLGKSTDKLELIVSKEVYDLLGDEAIKLFDPKALQVLEDIREILGIPLICNN